MFVREKTFWQEADKTFVLQQNSFAKVIIPELFGLSEYVFALVYRYQCLEVEVTIVA